MKVGEFCNRQVIVAQGDESLKIIAELMRTHHVGDVVVIKEDHNTRIPIGIITDRDLVLEVLATGLGLEKLVARDLITEPVAVIREDKDLFDALELMRQRAVRRLPVVDNNNILVGILTIDDITELLTEMIGSVSEVINRQQKQEIKRRPGQN